MQTTERGEDGKWALCMHTTCVHIPHTHISVSEVGSWSLWGAYPGVLSDTPTECVTQCANVPSLKQNTRHHALSRICALNQTWYHLRLRATLFRNYTIEQCRVCLHWRLLVQYVFDSVSQSDSRRPLADHKLNFSHTTWFLWQPGSYKTAKTKWHLVSVVTWLFLLCKFYEYSGRKGIMQYLSKLS